MRSFHKAICEALFQSVFLPGTPIWSWVLYEGIWEDFLTGGAGTADWDLFTTAFVSFDQPSGPGLGTADWLLYEFEPDIPWLDIGDGQGLDIGDGNILGLQ